MNVALTWFLLVPWSIVATTTTAAADTQGCVSHGEYDNLVRYLSTSQVAARFDTNGTYDGGNDDVFRRVYPPCWTNSREVVVRYSQTNGLTVSWDIRDS